MFSTSSFGSNIQWLDLGENSILSFDDGASFLTLSQLEVRGEVQIDFNLSETGFATLNLGGLWDGNTADWSDFTFNVDISEYDLQNGSSIVLMDFSSHANVFNSSFTPVVNIINNNSSMTAELHFDTASSQLILQIVNQ